MSRLERIRAYVDGTLLPPERNAFEASLARDGELARDVETYRLVVAATPEAVPSRTTRFEDLRPRRRVPLLVAAALLLASAATLWFQRPGAEPPSPPPVVRLAAIPARAVEPIETPDWPRALLDYVPSGPDGLHWLTDDRAAEELAAASGRRLLVFVHHKQCPYCLAYEKQVFRDPAVGAAADAFVLLKLDVERLPAWAARHMPKGWPAFLVFDRNARHLDDLTGRHDAARFAPWLRRAASASPPAWTRLHSDARGLTDPERWQEIARTSPSEVLRAAAASCLQHAAVRARGVLEDARAASPAVAKSVLATAEDELRGTPYAADLARVRRHIEAHGAFPTVVHE
ncbi:MAG: thioredoxin family protein [Planctomycetota bacterium]